MKTKRVHLFMTICTALALGAIGTSANACLYTLSVSAAAPIVSDSYDNIADSTTVTATLYNNHVPFTSNDSISFTVSGLHYSGSCTTPVSMSGGSSCNSTYTAGTSYGGTVTITAMDNSRGSQSIWATCQVLVADVEIYQGSNAITWLNNNPAVAGVNVGLEGYVWPSTLTVSASQWAVEDSGGTNSLAIAGYSASSSSGIVTPLTGAALQEQTLSYYYVTAATGAQVGYNPTVTLNSVPYDLWSVLAAFDVSTATISQPPTVTPGTVYVDQDVFYQWGSMADYNGWVLHAGNGQLAGGQQPAISFTPSGLAAPYGYAGNFNWGNPASGGNLFWVQLLNSPGSPSTVEETGNGGEMGGSSFGEDTRYPNLTSSPWWDAPGWGLPDPSAYTDFAAAESYSVFLMFQPAGGIPVPVEEVDWKWSGDAKSTDGGNNWSPGVTVAPQPVASPATAEPTWGQQVTWTLE